MVPWRWAAASAIGTSHIRSGERLQDAYAVSTCGKDHVLAVVSDGAGSAGFGAYGAWLVCRKLKVRFQSWSTKHESLPDDETLVGWINESRDCIAAIAVQRDSAPRQFAATLAALFISPLEVVALHIGDSAIVGRCDSKWKVICWPQTGEYASTTYFVTDEPRPVMNVVRGPCEYDAFALFSDGVGEFALSQLHQQAHVGFFEPMFRAVDASTDTGRLPELSRKLGTFLSGPSVCKRTDDDKTLILLSGA